MTRLGSPGLNNTFNPGALPDSKGDGQVLAIELLAADPTLVAGQPRAWFNTTTKIIKISPDGTTTYATAALT